jgi:hypothetical protein
VDDGDALTPGSDMWAFAATMLHVLTGSAPWSGLNVGQITMQVGRRTGASEGLSSTV